MRNKIWSFLMLILFPSKGKKIFDLHWIQYVYIFLFVFIRLKLNEIIFSNNIYKNISVFQYLY